MSRKRVAIVHYWLVGMRGGERVLERLLYLFPDADIFTHVYDPEAVSPLIRSRPIQTTFIQKLPGATKHYQKYLPLMPMALEELDLRGYDLVICSESGPAKGVIAAPDAQYMCYCHSPMRYLWDMYHDYRQNAGRLTRGVMSLTFPGLRNWDVKSAQNVDTIIANSTFIKKRIRRAWGRDSTVVHPPVATHLFERSDAQEPHYLWVGQMTHYKRPDLAVAAFNELNRPLLMIGDGDQSAAIKRMAGPSITIKDRLNFKDLRDAYARCRGLVFTAEEDFGIVPVEAMAAGRPVLAFGRGGTLDSIKPDQTGLFFSEQSVASVVDGVRRMEAWLPDFRPDDAIAQAGLFAPERFDEGIMTALRS